MQGVPGCIAVSASMTQKHEVHARIYTIVKDTRSASIAQQHQVQIMQPCPITTSASTTGQDDVQVLQACSTTASASMTHQSQS